MADISTCPACGKELPPNAGMCPNCGKGIAGKYLLAEPEARRMAGSSTSCFRPLLPSIAKWSHAFRRDRGRDEIPG